MYIIKKKYVDINSMERNIWGIGRIGFEVMTFKFHMSENLVAVKAAFPNKNERNKMIKLLATCSIRPEHDDNFSMNNSKTKSKVKYYSHVSNENGQKPAT